MLSSERSETGATPEQLKAYNGFLRMFTAQGMEGHIVWALQDERFIVPAEPNSPYGEQWLYDGLHFLTDGDKLTIYEKDKPTEIEWEGELSFNTLPYAFNPAEPIDAFHVNADASQDGIGVKKWANYFIQKYPAKLESKVPAVGSSKRN